MARVLTKKSTVAAKVPLATDLEIGELAVNTADAKLYTKHSDNTVKQLGIATSDSRLTDAREWTASTVTQAEAEAGTATTRRAWTAQRVFQAIAAWWAASAMKTKLDGIATGATANTSTDSLAEGATNLYHTAARVLATALSGLSLATGGAITSADTVLVAFGKLQKQITDLIATVSGKQDTLVSGTNIKTINGNSVLGSGNLTISGGGAVSSVNGRTGAVQVLVPIIIACSDETTALTAGTAKVTFRMPYAFTVTGVLASLTTAQASGSTLTVDINEDGSSILSTKLTIDNTEKTSATAATAPVISDSAIAADAEITIDIDQVGDGTATGLKVTLVGYQP